MATHDRPSPVITRDTVEAQIYRSLRQDILAGVYQEGERMVQRTLAERMGTSRIPVRDALKRLEVDGLLAKDDNGSYYCKRFGVDDLEEVYTLRMLLEPHALRLAMRRLDADALGYLRELLAAMDQAVAAKDQDRYLDLNREFHMTLYEASGQPRLMQIIKGLWSGRPLFVAGDLGHTRSAGEHHAIFAAIEEGDADLASRLLHDHVGYALNVLRARFPGPRGDRERADDPVAEPPRAGATDPNRGDGA